MPGSSPPLIYASYSFADREAVGKLADALQDQLLESGIQFSWLDSGDIPLGANAGFLWANADIILAWVSVSALADQSVLAEWRSFSSQGKSLIPLYLLEAGSVKIPSFLQDYHGVDLLAPGGVERLIDGLKRLVGHAPLPRVETASPIDETLSAALLVRHISLTNIRCFETFELTLTDDAPALFTMILGDNAAGKSTLLRSIALGLSSESEASSLIKQLPGSFVRRGAEEGSIHLDLYDPESGQEYSVVTRILKNGSTDERIRKETQPDPFPWQDVFVCAYGTNRSRQAAASFETYTLHQAVLSLFDDDTVLQNPEVVLLRQDPSLRQELERRLLRVLMLDDADYEIVYPKTGPEIQGPWGDQPLRVLSDGYRSTAQWVLDFLSWSIYAGRLGNGGDVGGILIVDELEQHLHPVWQRHVVQRLHQQFPKTQIFASTHTPLAAASTADVDASLLLRLKTQADGTITAVEIDPRSLAGLRADQVLASEAFGLYTTRNPGSEDDFARYAELLGKESRSAEEEEELERLKTSLEGALQVGETEAEREVEQAVEAALKARVTHVRPELLDIEVRRQLHELFAGDKAD